MSNLLKKLNGLEIEKTLSTVDSSLNSISRLTEKTETILAQAEVKKLSIEITKSLQQLQMTLKGFQQDAPLYNNALESMNMIKNLGEDFQKGAPAYEDIRRSLKSIEQLTDELQPFSKSLNEHPNILIFDKSPTEDIQPRKGQPDE